MMKCGDLNCNKPRTKTCSACLKEVYRSSECQKADWKIHKIMCSTMKDEKLLPFAIVNEKIAEFKVQIKLKEAMGNKIRLYLCLLNFAVH